MKKIIITILLTALAVPCSVQAQNDYSGQRTIRDLKSEVSTLELKVRYLEQEVRSVKSKLDDAAVVLFFFGVFCALWAQNTDRNPWLWFFLGLFFHVITAFFLLSKNAAEKRIRKSGLK